MRGRMKQPRDEPREPSVSLTFDLLILCFVHQSLPAQPFNIQAAAGRKRVTFDRPDSSKSQREQREEQQPEHDSVASGNIFSTGNGSEPLWSGQEQKNTFLLTERHQIQAGNFLLTMVIKALRQRTRLL